MFRILICFMRIRIQVVFNPDHRFFLQLLNCYFKNGDLDKSSLVFCEQELIERYIFQTKRPVPVMLFSSKNIFLGRFDRCYSFVKNWIIFLNPNTRPDPKGQRSNTDPDPNTCPAILSSIRMETGC